MKFKFQADTTVCKTLTTEYIIEANTREEALALIHEWADDGIEPEVCVQRVVASLQHEDVPHIFEMSDDEIECNLKEVK